MGVVKYTFWNMMKYGIPGSSSPGAGVVSGGELGAAGRPPPARLKRFLSTLVQFATDINSDVGDRVRSLVHSLVVRQTIDKFNLYKSNLIFFN